MAQAMNTGKKNFFKGPLIYLLLAPLIVLLGWSLLSGGGSREITTEQGLELLSEDKVAKAVIIDGDQRVNLTLTEADAKLGTDVHFFYVTQRGDAVVEAVNEANPADGFNDQVPQPSGWLSFLGFILPLLLIGLFFWWMISSMQGGGRGVMQFGKSRAKLVTKETPSVTLFDVACADDAVEELDVF